MDYAAHGYIPIDRRQAIAQGRQLPERAQGAVLLADLSGFTPLTEKLTTTFGAHRGAEELTRYLNLIHNALSDEINRYRGSVVGFSGDGITCWFDDESAEVRGVERAVAAAVAMQGVMQGFSRVELPDGETITLAMKVAVASGAVQRFLVGDPNNQLIDVLAGQIMERVAAGEHLANKGEVLVDTATLAQVGDWVMVMDWREDEASGERFAVISDNLQKDVHSTAWLILEALDESNVVSWLLPAMRQRLHEGLGEFSTELRPAAALFLSFRGINYEGDKDARTKLDAYIQHVQAVLARYEGILIQLTIGEKGSYLYAAFGAPIAHEDDVLRAVSVALELRTPPHDFHFISGVQIGISHGTMRVGAYGSTTRRTYGVLGDDVNLAARLMQQAGMGEILGSERVQRTTEEVFSWQLLPPLQVKGKNKPVARARLLGKPQVLADAVGFTGDFVGHEAELEALTAFFKPLNASHFAGVAYLYGEPGIGKSRMAYELRQHMRRMSWFTFSADKILRQSLYPFKHFLREYFDQYVRSTEDDNKARFDEVYASLLNTPALEYLRSDLEEARPFLGSLVDLYWDNSTYDQAEPKSRFRGTLLAFKLLVQAESLRQPVILHIEDAHWLDPDSRTLLAELMQDAGRYAWGMLVNSRYEDQGHGFTLNATETIPQTTLHIEPLPAQETGRLTKQILGGEVSSALADLMDARTGGNPFFIEHLALDMRERGMLVKNADGIWNATEHNLSEVPTSISAVLVARLDRLPAQPKAAVQVAAVLGQVFETPVLKHVLGSEVAETVKQLEAEAIWSVVDATHVQFQHSLLRDAAYEMQEQSRLIELHALAGYVMEDLYASDLGVYAADLTYHFGKAGDKQRERFFARLAGETAAAHYANNEALTYFSRALELTNGDEHDMYSLLLARESVYDLLGDRTAQAQDLQTLDQLANHMHDSRKTAEAALLRANYAEVTSSYGLAAAVAEMAVQRAQQSGATDIETAAWLAWGRALGWQGHYDKATECLKRALVLAQEKALTRLEADCLRNLGIVAYAQGDYPSARDYQQHALHLSATIRDRRGESSALHNLSQIASEQSDFAAAQDYQEQALRLTRETGDRRGENSVLNVSQIGLREQSYEEKRRFHEQALQLSREISNRRGESNALAHLGDLALEQGEYTAAQAYYQQALEVTQAIGFRRGEIRALTAIGRIFYLTGDYAAALEYGHKALEMAEATGDKPEKAGALMVCGHVLLAMKQNEAAMRVYEESFQLRKELGQPPLALEAQAGLARAAVAQDDLAQATKRVDAILAELGKVDFEAMNEPLEVCLSCFRVLQMNQDARAKDVLDVAYRLMQNRALKIEDAEQRRVYLEKAPASRELMTAWAWATQR